jgi:RecA/RadA recombinase
LFQRLLEIKGFSDAKVEKLHHAASQCGKEFGFQTGRQLLEKRERIMRITTGSDALDELLGGGVETGSITEAFGEFRTGKTQLAHTLAVTAQLDLEQKGAGGKVIFIDTEGTFRPNRIQAIAERFNVNGSEALENILVARAFNSESQHEFLQLASAHMVEQRHALIIVDSCTALFRVDFLGRGQLAERQQKLGQFLSILTRMAEEFNVACFITNQVVSDPGGNPMGFASLPKPIGGNIMAHACCTRLMLRKGKGETRICKIYDSPCLPEDECTYALGQGGVENPKD